MLHSGEPGRFDEMCDKMQALVLKAGMPEDVRERIVVAYRAMGRMSMSPFGLRPPVRTAPMRRSPG